MAGDGSLRSFPSATGGARTRERRLSVVHDASPDLSQQARAHHPRWRSHWLPSLLLCAIVAGGSWIRLSDLGRTLFNIDEATQYFVADSIAAGHGARLPSGEEYGRGIDVSRLMALSQRLIANPEAASRLPSALFGVLNLLLFAAVCWAIAGPWAAVWACLLLAAFPELVEQSRRARFYTYQMCFVIPALYAAWRTLLACSHAAVARAWLWAAATAALLLLGARVQVTTLSAALGLGVAIAGAGLAEALRPGGRSWRANPALQLTAAGTLLLALVLALRAQWISNMLAIALVVPLWAGADAGDPRYYHWLLTDAIPLFYSLSPLILACVWALDPRLGLLLTCWFGVPFLLHSLVLPWKGERFLLSALPALFLACGIAASTACEALRALTERWFAARRVGTRAARGLALVLVAVCAGFAALTTPELNTARKLPGRQRQVDWREALRRMERAADGSELPLGSSLPLPALFYWGRLDFTVGREFLEADVEGNLRVRDQGATDYYSGTPVFTTPDAIRAAFAGQPAVFVAIEPAQLHYGNIDPTLMPVLRSEARELCEDACRGLQVFLWPLQGTVRAPAGTGGAPTTTAPPDAPSADAPRAPRDPPPAQARPAQPVAPTTFAPPGHTSAFLAGP